VKDGLILYGINNIFTVQGDDGRYECRFKGKKLKDTKGEYSPLAPGDRVKWEIDENHAGKGMILSRIERENNFSRWNKKRNSPQTLAANLDLLVCLTSPVSPPFRPRFIDRVLLLAAGHFPVLLVINKADQGVADDIEESLEIYRSIGYDVMAVSAKTGQGLDELVKKIEGKRTAVVGQSGVGKSTLLNTLDPNFNLRVGEVSEKYNRGKHTTNYGIMLPWREGWIIDTPGIREIHVHGLESRELAHFMPEFRPLIENCKMPSCLHMSEPKCAVKAAVEAGKIHPERYESYLRMYWGLKEIEEENPYG